MIVELYTVTEDNEAVWVDAYIDENKITLGYKIPAYVDEELDLIVYTDELNLFVGGGQITVKSTVTLLEILEERFA